MGVGNDEQQGLAYCGGAVVLPINPTHARYGNLKIKKSPHPRRGVSEGGDPEGNPPPEGGGVGVQSVVFTLTVGLVTCEWCQC